MIKSPNFADILNYMDLLLNNILKGANYSLFGAKNEGFIVKSLLFDSRKLNNSDGVVFFAIKTLSNNGEKYIAKLYSLGVRIFVTENLPQNIESFSNASFILVERVIDALHFFAKFKRNQFHKPIVAITGSNGKTIVKEWLRQLNSNDKKINFSPLSYNSQIGVSLSLWNINKNDDFSVIEAGISQKGEMEKLERIISPSIGLITNIGDAHQVYFKSLQEKIQEKIILFKNSEIIIYPFDNTYIRKEILNSYSNKNKALIGWGFDNEAEFCIKEIEKTDKTRTIHYIYRTDKKGRSSCFTIPFTDSASIENAISAYLLALVLGYEKDKLNSRTTQLQPINMRLEMKEGINGTLIINDSYSLDFLSLETALNFINEQNTLLNKTIILSDITQYSTSETDFYTKLNQVLKEKKISKLIGIGKGFEKNKSILTIPNEIFPSTQEFLKTLSLKDYSNEIILIKGAREFEFEKISMAFEKKSHQTILEINLSALSHNINFYKSKLNDGVRLMAMVKAHGYGSGEYEIASVLDKQKVDYLTVAFADEGVEIRNKGINIPIMVLSPERNSIAKILDYDLEPEVYSIYILNELINAKQKLSHKDDNKTLNIHLKLDTGMHRLGIEEKDILPFLSLISKHKDIHIKSIFSHLACADNPALDSFTQEQIHRFETMSQKIMQSIDYPILRHIANSAAISRFPNVQYDMVRLGIGMYGIGVSDEETKHLHAVHRLKTIIISKREIKKGESVGYGRVYIADRDTTICVIPIGYADGLNRHLGNGKGRVWIKGSLVPIIGNICMDMCMIDCYGMEISEGDEVIIFGQEYPVTNLANQLNTIPYEIFTSISSRVKKVGVRSAND